MDNRNISSIKDYVVHNICNLMDKKTDEDRIKEIRKKGKEQLELFEYINRKDTNDDEKDTSYFKYSKYLKSKNNVNSCKKDLLYLGLSSAIEEHTFLEYSIVNDSYRYQGEIFLTSAHHLYDEDIDYFSDDASKGILWNLLTFVISKEDNDTVQKENDSYHTFVEYKIFEYEGTALYIPTTEIYLWIFIEKIGFTILPGIPKDEHGITLSFHRWGDKNSQYSLPENFVM